MLVFRWVLGVVITLLGSGFLFLFVASNGFRRSFGASDTSVLVALIPLIAGMLLVLGLIFPLNKILLHIGAFAALVLAGFCAWVIITESAAEMWIPLVCVALWLFYYWQTVFHTAG